MFEQSFVDVPGERGGGSHHHPPLAEAAAAAAPAAGFGVPRDAGARERCQVYVVGKDVSSWKLTNSCWEQRPGCEMGVQWQLGELPWAEGSASLGLWLGSVLQVPG